MLLMLLGPETQAVYMQAVQPLQDAGFVGLQLDLP